MINVDIFKVIMTKTNIDCSTENELFTNRGREVQDSKKIPSQ